MHYSAKRGLASFDRTIACRPSIRPASVRPSVCPCVTLVDHDHIGWKSWKLIARTISPTPSLFIAQRPSTVLGEHVEILGRRGRVGKSGVLEHKSGNISETRKEKKLLSRAYRNSPTLFRTVPFQTSYAPIFFDYPLLSQE